MSMTVVILLLTSAHNRVCVPVTMRSLIAFLIVVISLSLCPLGTTSERPDNLYSLLSSFFDTNLEMESVPTFTCSICTDKKSYSGGEPVLLNFELHNNDPTTDYYALKWHTPLEGFRNKFLTVTHEGQTLPYRGIMAKRGNPLPDNYVLVPAGKSVSGSVDIRQAYDLSAPGRYSVLFDKSVMDVIPKIEGEELVPHTLNEKWNAQPLKCGPINFKII